MARDSFRDKSSDPVSDVTSPDSVSAVPGKPTRWEVQHSPRYGAPFEMIYYSETEEECKKWLEQYGSQYKDMGALQTVRVG